MRINTALLPLVDLVFLALGALLAGMTQMEMVRAIPVDVTRVGQGAASVRLGDFDVLTLIGPGVMALNGQPIREEDLTSLLEHKRVVLRIQKKLPTEEAVKVLALLAQVSCNNDDESKAINLDPIIGSWLLVRVFDLDAGGELNSEENYELNCDRPTIIILKTDGGLNGIGDCFEAGIVYEGTWLKLSNGFYSIEATVIPPDGGHRPLFDDHLNVSFVDNRMLWAFEEESEELIYFEFRKQ